MAESCVGLLSRLMHQSTAIFLHCNFFPLYTRKINSITRESDYNKEGVRTKESDGEAGSSFKPLRNFLLVTSHYKTEKKHYRASDYIVMEV